MPPQQGWLFLLVRWAAVLLMPAMLSCVSTNKASDYLICLVSLSDECICSVSPNDSRVCRCTCKHKQSLLWLLGGCVRGLQEGLSPVLLWHWHVAKSLHGRGGEDTKEKSLPITCPQEVLTSDTKGLIVKHQWGTSIWKWEAQAIFEKMTKSKGIMHFVFCLGQSVNQKDPVGVSWGNAVAVPG